MQIGASDRVESRCLTERADGAEVGGSLLDTCFSLAGAWVSGRGELGLADYDMRF